MITTEMRSASANPGGGDWRHVTTAALLALIIVFGAVLRLYGLEGESAFLDETYTIELFDAPDAETFFRLYRMGDPLTPPVYLAGAYYWSKAFGTAVWRVRLFSILFGILGLPAMFLLVRRLYGLQAGLVSCALLSVSVWHIYYSQEIRGYSLVLLLSIVSAYSFVRLLEGGPARWWLVNLLANGLLLATHLLAAMMPLWEGVFLLAFRWRQWRLVLAWGIANAMAVSPVALWLLASDLDSAMQKTGWMTTPSLKDAALMLHWASGIRVLDTPVSLAVAAALILVNVIAPACLVVRSVRPQRLVQGNLGLKPAETLGYLALWILIPPLAALILSYLWKPMFMARYILYSLLPLVIIIGGAYATVGKRARVCLALALALLYGYQLRSLAHPLRTDWRAAAQLVQTNGQRDDYALVIPRWQRDSFRFYSSLPPSHVVGLHDGEGIGERVREYRRRGTGVWVVLWPVGYLPETVEAALTSAGMSFSRRDVPGPGIDGLHVYRVRPVPGAVAVDSSSSSRPLGPSPAGRATAGPTRAP